MSLSITVSRGLCVLLGVVLGCHPVGIRGRRLAGFVERRVDPRTHCRALEPYRQRIKSIHAEWESRITDEATPSPRGINMNSGSMNRDAIG